MEESKPLPFFRSFPEHLRTHLSILEDKLGTTLFIVLCVEVMIPLDSTLLAMLNGLVKMLGELAEHPLDLSSPFRKLCSFALLAFLSPLAPDEQPCCGNFMPAACMVSPPPPEEYFDEEAAALLLFGMGDPEEDLGFWPGLLAAPPWLLSDDDDGKPFSLACEEDDCCDFGSDDDEDADADDALELLEVLEGLLWCALSDESPRDE